MRLNKTQKLVLFLSTSFAFIGCDRVTKSLAKAHLMYAEPQSFFYDTVRLLYVENTGAALSFGSNLPQPYNFIILSLIPLVVLFGLTIHTLSKLSEMSTLQMLSFGSIIAGGVGNIIDRLLHDRHVPDFLNIGINDVRTGIFNVADICVTAGAISLLVSYYWFKNEEDVSKAV